MSRVGLRHINWDSLIHARVVDYVQIEFVYEEHARGRRESKMPRESVWHTTAPRRSVALQFINQRFSEASTMTTHKNEYIAHCHWVIPARVYVDAMFELQRALRKRTQKRLLTAIVAPDVLPDLARGRRHAVNTVSPMGRIRRDFAS
jgi:hypothetical protein